MQSHSTLIQSLNTAIAGYTATASTLQPKELYEPFTYILASGGKRIRPLLCLIGCDLFGKPHEAAMPAAMAVELFHNFSLIHDDILDNAPLRRGQPTVHEKWNTNIAILSGDGMLVKAFELIAQAEPAKVPVLLSLFAKTASEVCEGQQADMNFETQTNVSVDDYVRMITGKTAVLLGCSLELGAICAGAGAEAQKHLYEFGKHIGIAFQLLDDVLDVYASDAAGFGKQVGGDIIANKKTFLLLKAFELSDAAQQTELQRLLSLNETQATEKVKGVMQVYDALHIRQLALAEADKHTQEAMKHLEALDADAVKKQALKELGLQLLGREN